ncbi:hypothetical protein AXW83_22590 [Bosea sp. PAMC 26642]|nr:hypothetical protein AXW83_22590 [Bosea sp. PAMC 26642]
MVVVPDLRSDGALAEASIRFAQAEHARSYLIYVSDIIAPVVYKRLLRTRAAEWSKWDELAQEFGDVLQRLAGIGPAPRAAKVVAFLPSKGGVGTSLLVIETAINLTLQNKRGGFRVAVLDLNFDGGTLADALDLQPQFDLRELTGRPDRLDNQLIEIFASRYSDRLDVFASPLSRKTLEQPNHEMIFAVLDLIADRYDLLLLDIPHQSLPWIDNLLLGSDAIVVCGTGTVPALRQLDAKLAHLDDLLIGAAKIGIVVNHCQSNLFGRIARRADIESALHRRQIFCVRSDDGAVQEAMNAGRPLTELSPGNRVVKDVRVLAQWVEETVGAPRTDNKSNDAKRGKRG